MGKRTMKGVFLGLTASSIISISGCGEKEVCIPQTAAIIGEEIENAYSDYNKYTGGSYVYKNQEYKEAYDPSCNYIINKYTDISYEEGFNTNDLFFIRMNGKIYLATKLIDINENNIISKYYAIDTGEFLGQTLEVNWYARAIKDIDTIVPPGSITKEYKVTVDENMNDFNYFNGEYGFGKNIFQENVISAASLLTEEKLSKEQIINLLEDELFTTVLVEKYNYPKYIFSSKEEYSFIPLRYSGDGLGITTIGYTVAFHGETSYYCNNEMHQFLIEDHNQRMIGYRVSTNPKDSGYYYIYDIMSSSYIDISKVNIIDEGKVNDSTIDQMKKKLNLSDVYDINDLKIISTLNLLGDDVFEDYYISLRGTYTPYFYNYKILGDKEMIQVYGNQDGASLQIVKVTEKGEIFQKSTPKGEYNGIVISLEKGLIDNNLSNYIKEYYTEEELSLLLFQLRKQELDLGEPLSTTKEEYRKIKLEDITVVDTLQENSNFVFVEGEKQYYILTPYKEDSNDSNQTRYQTTEGAFCIVTLDDYCSSIEITTFGKTLFWVIKPEKDLKCFFSLETILQELGLEDEIQDEYAFIDLQQLAHKINEKQKVLIHK